MKGSKKVYNFSIVVPCFNMGDTLSETIDSLLSQTLENIQIIIVDDASTDKKTKLEIQKYSNVADIIWLEKNGGLSHARNVGIRAVKSQYVLCLDSDDKIASTYLQKAKEIFDSNENIGIVSVGVQNFGVSKKRWMPKDNFSLLDIMTINHIPVASCVRKSVYEDVGVYDESMKVYEDWDLWIRIFASQKQWKLKVISEYLFFYRVRETSMMHSLDETKMKKAVSIIMHKHKKMYMEHFDEIFRDIHTRMMKCNVQKDIGYDGRLKITKRIITMKKKFFPNKWI